jgi:hypothetical protein
VGVQGRGIAEAPKVVGIVPSRRLRLHTLAEAMRSKINPFGIEYDEKSALSPSHFSLGRVRT